MRERLQQRNVQLVLIVALAILVELAFGAMVARWHFGLRELAIIAIGTVAVLVALIPRPEILRVGYYFWLVTFIVGWRQIWITSNLKLHPSEVVIWFLFGLSLLQQLFQQRDHKNWLPITYAFFIPFCVIGVVTAWFNHIPWDVALAELKPMLVVIPIFYVVSDQVRTFSDLRYSILAVVLVAASVSILGITEYFAPGLVAPFRGYFGAQPILYSEQGFAREDFTFFGGAITSVFLATVLILNLALAYNAKTVLARIGWGLSFAVTGFALYLSGSRGPWAGAALGLVVFVLFDLRRRGFILLGGLLALPFMPKLFFNQLYAVFDPYQYYDTSVLVRRGRFESALDVVWQNPLFGRGWGSSGWVHSDLVQIAANLGIPAFLLFAGWYLGRLWGLGKVLLHSDNKEMATFAAALLGGLLTALVCLGSEAAMSLPQLIIPVWLVVALAEAVARLAQQPA